jgi:uncharacterized protein YqgV (UPF0045/DUF77 family)
MFGFGEQTGCSPHLRARRRRFAAALALLAGLTRSGTWVPVVAELLASSGELILICVVALAADPYDPVVQQLEFTIEPFVEGRPGPHVTAAVEAATAAGAEVEFGPFGSTCEVDDSRMPDIVAAITRAAFEHGATHVSLHVARVDDRP